MVINTGHRSRAISDHDQQICSQYQTDMTLMSFFTTVQSVRLSRPCFSKSSPIYLVRTKQINPLPKYNKIVTKLRFKVNLWQFPTSKYQIIWGRMLMSLRAFCKKQSLRDDNIHKKYFSCLPPAVSISLMTK